MLEDRIEDFALAESRDQGKPVSLARNMDMRRAVVNLRAFAEAWKSHVGTSNEVGIGKVRIWVGFFLRVYSILC